LILRELLLLCIIGGAMSLLLLELVLVVVAIMLVVPSSSNSKPVATRCLTPATGIGGQLLLLLSFSLLALQLLCLRRLRSSNCP
jgi:hypothetical protein